MAKPQRAPAASKLTLQPGLVVSSHGRHSIIESPDGSRRLCHPRGKKNSAVVGDRIQWAAPPVGQGEEGTIEKLEPRRNLFYRQDELRTKAFAANIDQVLIWIAAEPVFSHKLLTRALIAAEAAHIHPVIVLNKSDLTAAHAAAWERLQPYRDMGYEMLGLSLTAPEPDSPALSALRALLDGKTTLVLGPSGSGKSTLINWLLPHANVATNTISVALNSGKHTTTSTHWYWIDEAHTSAVIDSPGFQEFGLHHIPRADLASFMPDLRAHVPECKFYNCTHLHEPQCGVLHALERAAISPERYTIYQELYDELSQTQF